MHALKLEYESKWKPNSGFQVSKNDDDQTSVYADCKGDNFRVFSSFEMLFFGQFHLLQRDKLLKAWEREILI